MVNSATAEMDIVDVLCTLEAFSGIVKHVGGDLVNVSYLLPEGASPHEYSLSPEDIKKAQSADLIVLVNSKFLSIESELKESLSDKLFLDFEDYEEYNITLLPAPGIEKNYHGYWLYPENAVAIARAVCEALTELMPEYKEIFGRNLDSFVEKVFSLKERMIQVSKDKGLYGGGVLLAVPAVAYVAYSFGMEPKETVLKAPGSFISPSELAEVEEEIDRGEIILGLCPDSFRDSKPGEIMEEISKTTGLVIAYVRIFSLCGLNDYLTLMSYNIGVISSVSKEESVSGVLSELTIYLVIGFIFVVTIAIIESFIIFSFRRKVEGVLHE